jgi:RNA polymerase sigma factor (sigma-70 family)
MTRTDEAGNYDLRVERTTRFKNLRLFNAIRKTGTVVEFSKAAGVHYSGVIAFLNLSANPYSARTGNLKGSAQEIVDYLDIAAEELFPPELYTNADTLRPQTAVLVGRSVEMLPLLAAKRVAAPEMLESAAMKRELAEDLYEILHRLKPRAQKVLVLRYGLNGHAEHTMAEVGEELGVSRGRIQQIEAKALRDLRAPKNSLKLVKHELLYGTRRFKRDAEGEMIFRLHQDRKVREAREAAIANSAVSADASAFKR